MQLVSLVFRFGVSNFGMLGPGCCIAALYVPGAAIDLTKNKLEGLTWALVRRHGSEKIWRRGGFAFGFGASAESDMGFVSIP